MLNNTNSIRFLDWWWVYGQSCGWKRPWQALHESTCKPLHSNRLDLNALAGEIDAADNDCGNTCVAQSQQSAVEAHYSECLIRLVTFRATWLRYLLATTIYSAHIIFACEVDMLTTVISGFSPWEFQ